MNHLLKGITYSYNRNIGWQDRTIRTLVGIGATIATFYFFNHNLTYSVLFGVLAIAQFGTALSARCIMCYFAGLCTIDNKEKKNLDIKKIAYEMSK